MEFVVLIRIQLSSAHRSKECPSATVTGLRMGSIVIGQQKAFWRPTK